MLDISKENRLENHDLIKADLQPDGHRTWGVVDLKTSRVAIYVCFLTCLWCVTDLEKPNLRVCCVI